ncbi:MAG: serine/threonine-protein kinase, partial [Myxococcales bacterium]
MGGGETRRVRAMYGVEVGGYRIVEELAQGGMGVLYVAEHPLLGARAVVKTVKERYAADAAAVARLVKEGRAQARVRSGWVPRLFDCAKLPDGRPALLMEHAAGESLEARLQEQSKLPLDEALRRLLQLSAALADVHRSGVIHCDVKAENVVLSGPGLRLVDFGVAHFAGEAREPGAVVLGTPPCMAPEQVSAQPVDFRADVYAAGVLGYRMLTGRYPFTGATAAEVMLKHLKEAPVAPEGVPPRLAQVLLRALAKKREERFDDGRALFDALRRVSLPEVRPTRAPHRLPPPVVLEAVPRAPEGPVEVTLQRLGARCGRD